MLIDAAGWLNCKHVSEYCASRLLQILINPGLCLSFGRKRKALGHLQSMKEATAAARVKAHG